MCVHLAAASQAVGQQQRRAGAGGFWQEVAFQRQVASLKAGFVLAEGGPASSSSVSSRACLPSMHFLHIRPICVQHAGIEQVAYLVFPYLQGAGSCCQHFDAVGHAAGWSAGCE